MTAVVGLDLSLTATGVALPDGVQTIRSRGNAGATVRERAMRLSRLAAEIRSVVNPVAYALGIYSRQPLLVVIEAPAFSRITGHQHDRSGLWWLVVSEVCASNPLDVGVAEVTPTARAKYATGRGNAGKDEVLAAVIRRYPDVDVSNNNEADALVLRAMGCDWLGEPLAEVPKANRAALDKVVWPEAVAP